MISEDFIIQGCSRVVRDPAFYPFYQWENTSCREKNGAAASALHQVARLHGREVTKQGLHIGDCLLIEPYHDEEQVWLARAVQFKMNEIGCFKKYDKRMCLVNVLTRGDHLIAVQ